MFEYVIQNTPIDADGFASDLDNANLTFLFSHIAQENGSTSVFFTQELFGVELAAYESVVANHDPSISATNKYVVRLVADAMAFGTALITEFGAENTLMGIEQLGMTRTVRRATADVAAAMQAGALLDAIQAMRDIPPEDKDATFVTDVRLLKYIQSVEKYLGLTLSTGV
jgi:hypothetical protein